MRLSRLFLLGVFLLGQSAYADGQATRFFDNKGGLIDHISPLLIPVGNASALTNVTLDDRGQLTKRNGYTINNSTGALGPTSFAVTGGGFHSAAVGTSFVGVIVGTDVYRTSNSLGGSYTLVTGTVTLTNSASNLAQTTSLNDSLVFCNESDPPFKLPASGNAVPLANAPTKVHTCATYGNYLILGNTTETAVDYPSRVRWSDINSLDVFPANNYIDVEPNDGDKIVSLIGFEDSVYVFKKRSIYRIIITGLPGADAFIIRPVARDVGAWSKLSVKVLNNIGVVFQAQNGLYLFNGQTLEPISDGIQRTMDAFSRSQWVNTVGIVYPKRNQYWLAYATTSSSTNNQVLVYDYVLKAWTIYTNIAANALIQVQDSVGNNVILSGDYSANVYKQDTGTADFALAISSSIAASYTTGDITLDTPELTKGLKYLYVFSQVDVNTTLTVEAAFDYSSAYEYSTTLDLGQAGALYDTAIYDTAVFPSIQYKVSRVELNRSARAVKLRFSNSSSSGILGVIGWVIIYSPEDWRQ